MRFRIIETEAYGKNDTACHSNKYKSGNGVVSQNMIGGTLYVHYNNKDKPGSMFDVVANKVGVGEGVLIRGGINLENPNEEYLSKPICLGEALKIDYNRLNQVDLATSELIWIEDDGFDCAQKIKRSKRIGLESSNDVKQEDKDTPSSCRTAAANGIPPPSGRGCTARTRDTFPTMVKPMANGRSRRASTI